MRHAIALPFATLGPSRLMIKRFESITDMLNDVSMMNRRSGKHYSANVFYFEDQTGGWVNMCHRHVSVIWLVAHK